MLRIGLTGGIGSGKTTIANIFSTLGIPIYDSDQAAKRLMDENESIREQLINQFGTETYKNNRLDRSFLASIVFNDDQQLQRINEIVHPATIQDSIEWFGQQNAAYAIKESALIFESSSERHLDYIIGVWTEEALRIDRVRKRSGLSAAEIRSRMEKQMEEKQKMNQCQFIIDNNEKESVIKQVFELHQKLLTLSTH
ncbi:dephospho-CoA kinase [Niabella insulamsoli]|uniref:dephospho-CoA kinase n=1 Tax=Niabella insulamsoli TaxID=3144874 RepID=UPI0031FBD0FF